MEDLSIFGTIPPNIPEYNVNTTNEIVDCAETPQNNPFTAKTVTIPTNCENNLCGPEKFVPCDR